MKLRAWGVLLAGLLVAADQPKEDAGKDELKKLQGAWSAVSGERDGKPAPENEISKIKLTFKDNKMSVEIDAESREVGIVTVKPDGGKAPRPIDLELTEGPDKGKIALGIYELSTDQLKLCVAKAGKDRPTEFSAKAGSENTLLVLKKAK